jgi:uncharacterized protein (TIGR01244 family)
MRRLMLSAIVAATTLTASLAFAQVTKETLPGVANFSRVETTIACAGATTPAAVAGVKKLGYAAIINLREASETGADLEAEEAAAKAAGITYIGLPFNTARPDPMVVERFVAAVSAPANQPAFVHCASANRASALWMIKRMLVDGWDADRAGTEAAALGLTNAGLKAFALDYVATHKK